MGMRARERALNGKKAERSLLGQFIFERPRRKSSLGRRCLMAIYFACVSPSDGGTTINSSMHACKLGAVTVGSGRFAWVAAILKSNLWQRKIRRRIFLPVSQRFCLRGAAHFSALIYFLSTRQLWDLNSVIKFNEHSRSLLNLPVLLFNVKSGLVQGGLRNSLKYASPHNT